MRLAQYGSQDECNHREASKNRRPHHHTPQIICHGCMLLPTAPLGRSQHVLDGFHSLANSLIDQWELSRRERA